MSIEARSSILCRLVKLDKLFDQGKGNDDLVNERTTLLKELQGVNARSSLDMDQKAKIRWSIKGDENSKYFHGIVNKERSQLAIRGILVEGDWIDEPAKKEDLERSVTYDEIKRAVWDCGTNKSPGPDGFTFDFIHRYWKVSDKDVVKAVEELFVSSKFPPGSNSSFITVIPKTQDAKMVKDFALLILDGLFILNELLSWWLFKGILIDNSLTLSHLFYAEDAVFIGKWDKSNLVTIVNVLKCFFLVSDLKINIHKSKLMAMYGVRGSLDNPGNLLRHSPLSDIIKEAGSLSLKGDFSVTSANTLIDDSFLPSVGNETRWVNFIPIKINVFAWKVCLDKLPTRFNLSLRGLDIPSILCPICHSTGESSSHLFFSCNVARLLQSKVARWWDLVVLDIHLYDDWLSWFSSLRLVKGLKDVLEGIFYVMWVSSSKYQTSNAIAFDSPYLLVLVTRTSQSRQHESRKPPTAELFDVALEGFPFITMNTKEYHSECFGNYH
nr:RNA-directed DNA polymerase, eukaryota [Tanacetum cinerariifolium]